MLTSEEIRAYDMPPHRLAQGAACEPGMERDRHASLPFRARSRDDNRKTIPLRYLNFFS